MPKILLVRFFFRTRCIWDQCNKKYILRTHRPTDDRPLIWENFKWPYLREGSSDPLHVWFYVGVFGVGVSNGAISGLTKFNRYVGENNARGVVRLVTIESISCVISEMAMGHHSWPMTHMTHDPWPMVITLNYARDKEGSWSGSTGQPFQSWEKKIVD